MEASCVERRRMKGEACVKDCGTEKKVDAGIIIRVNQIK